MSDATTAKVAEPLARKRYAPISQAFLSGLGEAARVPLIPDPFQQAAVTASLDSDVVVVAPSGSGKTWIAERAISRALANGQTVCYTTPLKALSNQKFRRFRTLFGYHSVGLLTGERRENTRAPIVVATTEILRNQLYGQGPFPELIILDEAHYLADPDRGSAWEEVMVLTPPTSLLLLLSATISNAEVLADWMASIRPRRPELITTEVRPVPLRYGWLGEQRSVLPMGLAPYLLDADARFAPCRRTICPASCRPCAAHSCSQPSSSGRRGGHATKRSPPSTRCACRARVSVPTRIMSWPANIRSWRVTPCGIRSSAPGSPRITLGT